MDPDTVDGEKQEVEPKSVSVNSRNKIMGAAALAVLLIVGVSVVAWHFTKQERKLLKVHTYLTSKIPVDQDSRYKNLALSLQSRAIDVLRRNNVM